MEHLKQKFLLQSLLQKPNAKSFDQGFLGPGVVIISTFPNGRILELRDHGIQLSHCIAQKAEDQRLFLKIFWAL